ncbi:MAG: Gfo/Idh/MocA family oxidoreductase [Armatimonadetes bacterium]|nr:Gfo/Idh/MocA family oxidoreductase [Armatimonadota bacterium]
MSVRVGVVGAGKFGVMHLDAFTQLGYTGAAELAAIAEANPARAGELRAQYDCPVYTDYREMIEKADIDAVTVATPDHLHREIAVAAARAGKHVLVEKPLDVTIEGCDEMVQAAKDSNVLLQVDFHKRYDPDHQAIERRVQAGDLGDILYGSVHMEDRIEVPSQWFPHWAPNSSPAWFLGVHFYDLVRWVIKSDVKSVYATGSKNTLLKDYGVDTYDCVNAKVEFENGATFAFDTSWIIPQGFESVVNQTLRVVGTRGVFECDSQYRGSRSCIKDEGMATYNNNFRRDGVDKLGRRIAKGYGIESIEDFAYNVAFLKEGGSIDRINGCWASGEDGREVTRIAVAVHESIKTGCIMRLR